MVEKPMKLSLVEKVGYGLGDTASNLVWATLMSFMMIYYTDVFGISAAAVGTMFLFARVLDGFLDFLMGAIADRTQTRWGRFRPFLLWMCVPMAVATVLTFTVPDFSPDHKLVYAWVTFNLLMVIYTAINIPYSALSGVMTDDPLERTGLNSYRMVLAQCGGFIVSGAMLPLVAWFGKGNAAQGYQMTAALFGVAVIVLFLITFATTRERIQPKAGQKTHFREDLARLVDNPHWLVLSLVALLNLSAICVRSGSLVYYAKYVVGMTEDRITTFMLLGNAGVIIGAIATRFAVAAIGKRNTMIVSHIVMAGSTALFYLLPPSSESGAMALQLIHSLAGGFTAVLFFAMIADTADYSEWKSGVRTTGIVFSATTFAQKLGMGIGGAFTGLLLTRFGYVANTAQTSDALEGILLLVSLVPAAGFLAVAVLFIRYGLTEAVCHEIHRDLAVRRAEHP
ncbi:MAG: MFS transporter [Verrucomicrobiaceae bacterium]|nr:MAG: MFS transporter [Verrucomicrobiaceae bacterium]